MSLPALTHRRIRPCLLALLGAGLVAGIATTPQSAEAQKPAFRKKALEAVRKPVAPPAPRSALLTVADWQKAPLTPLKPGELDELVDQELRASKITPAPLTNDEQ